MKKLSAIVPEAIAREEVLRAGRAKMALKKWEEVVGPMLATKSWPDKYDHGTVWIAVTSSVWAQELRMVKEKILGKLRQIAADGSLFSDLRFGVRPLPDREVEEAPDTRAADYRRSIEGLTMQEIRERRLNRWTHDIGD